MREILFRGKRVDNGEWIKGYYVFQKKRRGTFGQTVSEADFDHGCIVAMSGEMHEVVPDTVGQYTGTKDRNGVKIFEGDIVRLNEDYDYGSDNRFLRIPLLVEWDMEMARFKAYKSVLPKGEVCVDTGLELYDDEYEVIGNIHDNPELLKGE